MGTSWAAQLPGGGLRRTCAVCLRRRAIALPECPVCLCLPSQLQLDHALVKGPALSAVLWPHPWGGGAAPGLQE